ncbi:hypothetical protein VTO42DRAFT_6456 [Malbranchea cinnamomea]
MPKAHPRTSTATSSTITSNTTTAAAAAATTTTATATTTSSAAAAYHRNHNHHPRPPTSKSSQRLTSPVSAATTTTASREDVNLSSANSSSNIDDASGWDYSETEWWGWIILLVTWLVFVVGMGSCLGVWSWAWDVGETPYAPPELEDDPTLPIVGYYPALMVLTAVMMWVWVIIAWVGMKYFRHAKIPGEDF